jgi:hypothetical protein
MWQEEVRRVAACSYPNELASVAVSQPSGSRVAPRWLREPTVIAAIIGLAGTILAVMIQAWISGRRSEPSRPLPERVVVEIVPQSDKPSQPRQAELPQERTAPQMPTLDEILDVLERHHQRATFTAVAGVLGRDPRSLFTGYVRTPRTAWVVNKGTGLPTGTKKADYPPGLQENERVIDATEELRTWLREHH